MKVTKKTVEAVIEPVPDDKAESPNGEFTLILSDPHEDREGDAFKPEEWTTPLPEHISIDTDHGMSVKSTIGSGKPVLQTNGEIHVAGTYASTAHAQETRTLVNEGHVRGASVTCLQRVTKSAGRTVIKREMLNGTITPIPANPRAVILTSKSLDAGAEVDETAQAFHDQALDLGATCGEHPVVGKTVTTVVAKGIKGSVEDMGERVRKAVRDAHADQRGYPYVRATFLDEPGKGTVVYDYETYDNSRSSKTLARDFTDDGKAVTLDDTPREVSLVTSVVDTDDDDETVAKSVATDAPVERAVELLMKAAGGMTREAALDLLGNPDTGDTVASSEGAAATAPADAAAEASAAAEAAATGAAASPAELRARALLLSIDAAG